ncbi:MAG: hypothetical protein OEV87_10040 [Phycisphaerae bacterium]|nr:hypothetical protein [Phycisphaerae bacterium]
MILTSKQIKKGFWCSRRISAFPPKKITSIEDYKPCSKLNLVITQLGLKSHQQKKLVQLWCEKLPQLNNLKYLWFNSRVNQIMFDSACRIPNLEGLYIKWSGIKDLSALQDSKHLTHLHIGSSSQIESIEVLGDLRNLIALDIEQLSKISDFGVLAKLTQLEGLGIDGSIWTPQAIDTLEPVGQLENLRYFTATNTKIKTKSFAPLLKLKNLVRFDCSWNYPAEEFEKLKPLPSLKYGNIQTSWKEIKSKTKKA